jgi:RNA recognition motif-containing protein
VGTKLYVANLSFRMTDRDLHKLFAPFGTITSAQVATDRESGRSRGFGFVEMGSEQEAQAAIAGLGSKEIEGRALIVEEYRPKTEGERRTPPPPARAPKERKKHAPPLGSRLRRPPPKKQ